ncbi:MAG: hypothetical protein DRN19_05255 [Thermoplasmata archaeon]|nr:MAG: hypothetical protein DRN19_05255 [Thermoplasmata archaeon]
MINNIIKKISGLCGLLLPIVMTIILITAILKNQWFSWTKNAISDFGAANSSPLLFNNGLILLGILLLIFSIGLIINFKEKLGPAIIFMCSFLLMLIGIFPVPHILHEPISVIFFISFSIAFFSMGHTFYKESFLSFVTGIKILALMVVVSTIFAFLFFIFYNWIAISEILVFYPGFIWCMVYSVSLIRNDYGFRD